jgi:hypothetical protein
MPDERLAERKPPFVHQHDLTNAAARRIRLEAPEAIGGAMIKAQTAMDTMQIVGVLRTI